MFHPMTWNKSLFQSRTLNVKHMEDTNLSLINPNAGVTNPGLSTKQTSHGAFLASKSTNSTAQGGGGSFKKKKRRGESVILRFTFRLVARHFPCFPPFFVSVLSFHVWPGRAVTVSMHIQGTSPPCVA